MRQILKEIEMKLHDRAIILNDLANSYAMKMQYSKAIERYKEALALYIELAKTKPVKYGLPIAHVFSNLSIIYLHLQKYDESEELHHNALKMHRVLSKYNPNRYAVELAQCLVDGVLYLKQHTFTLYEAEMAINTITLDYEKDELIRVIRKLHTVDLS